MNTRPLEGKKIAVLVESEYIPEEIAAYRERFAALGATVELLTRLWGNTELALVSDVDAPAETLAATRAKLETMTVHGDVERARVEDYAAVLVAANYTSVRLRYFDAPQGAPIAPEQVRSAPAVRFFARAMRSPSIVKGALCHALWLLTPVPELLAGRRVICHSVVLSDIVNAGAVYTPRAARDEDLSALQPARGVVVDGDLVTGESRLEVEDYIQVITAQILHLDRREQERNEAAARAPRAPVATSRRRILVVLSERGYWGEELVGPLETFDAAGYEVEFATPTGKRPGAVPPSMDPDYIDPPLGRSVTSDEVARKTRELDDVSETRSAQSRRLDHPKSLAAWIPERPYYSQPHLVRALEAYNRGLSQLERDLAAYDALLVVGGSGPIVDLVNNDRVHALILAFHRLGKPIAAECYGVGCLAFARDLNDRQSILRGKRVTGHCVEYDYKDGTGFLGTDFNMGPPPYPLEYILRDATGPDGAYIGNFGKETSVIVDYPFITGRSTPDSYLTGQKLVEVLDQGLRRYGW